MIKKIFKENDIEITDHQDNQFQRYYELMIEWNEKINLTAIKEYKEVIYKHFLDSALIIKSDLFVKENSASVLDLGTGAGFPGIVLAILYPQYKFYLVDSLMKRIEFLHIIKSELKLDQITLHHGRAEDLGRKEEFRNQFDFVVSRAVAELPVLLEYCIPFVKKDGFFISYKSGKAEDEILKGIREAKNMCEYDSLSDSAYLRAKEDYLIGINFSRLLSIIFGNRVAKKINEERVSISVGRVMTCVLGMVVSREREIRNFVKTKYYKILRRIWRTKFYI